MGTDSLVVLSLPDKHYAELTADQCFRAASIPVSVRLNVRNLMWEVCTTAEDFFHAAETWLEWYGWMVKHERPLRPQEHTAGRALRAFVDWVRGED